MRRWTGIVLFAIQLVALGWYSILYAWLPFALLVVCIGPEIGEIEAARMVHEYLRIALGLCALSAVLGYVLLRWVVKLRRAILLALCGSAFAMAVSVPFLLHAKADYMKYQRTCIHGR